MNNIVPEINPSNEYEKLDLLDVNAKLKAIRKKIYSSTKAILPKETIKDASPEEILEQRRRAIDEYEKDGEFSLLKIEYEFLIELKKKLEKRRDDKRQEILETLQKNPEILDIPLRWLVSVHTTNVLRGPGIHTLKDLKSFIEKGDKFIENGFTDKETKRQNHILRYRNIWPKWIKELEDIVKKYNLVVE